MKAGSKNPIRSLGRPHSVVGLSSCLPSAALTCRNAPYTIHQHPGCVTACGSRESAYTCVNLIAFSPSYFLTRCFSYLHVAPARVLARRDREVKGQVLPLRVVEGQGQPSLCFSERQNQIQAASVCIYS